MFSFFLSFTVGTTTSRAVRQTNNSQIPHIISFSSVAGVHVQHTHCSYYPRGLLSSRPNGRLARNNESGRPPGTIHISNLCEYRDLELNKEHDRRTFLLIIVIVNPAMRVLQDNLAPMNTFCNQAAGRAPANVTSRSSWYPGDEADVVLQLPLARDTSPNGHAWIPCSSPRQHDGNETASSV